MQPPEIVHHLPYQPALLGYQLGFERPAAGEGIVRQHPPTEAMDVKYRGAVKAQNGVVETPQAQFLSMLPLFASDPLSCSSLYLAANASPGFHQLTANPAAQFGSRRFGAR